MINLSLWIATAVVLWAAIFFVRPAVARARFEEIASSLRDDAVDAIIAGRLPSKPSVKHFRATAEMYAERSASISLSQIVTTQRCLQRVGFEPPPPPDMSDLTPSQRELLMRMHGSLVRALADYLVCGSVLWWILQPVRAVRRLLHSWHRNHPAPAPDARVDVKLAYADSRMPHEIAERYTRQMENGARADRDLLMAGA